MIQRLDHSNSSTASAIHHIFQKSYRVEAELLKAKNFPPLQRAQESFLESKNIFFGFYMDEQLAAVIEVAVTKNATHIQSLVVLPKYFRMGIAGGLISFVLSTFPTRLFTVETGLKNTPAVALYQKFGFTEVSQWDTDHGVRKIRLEKEL